MQVSISSSKETKYGIIRNLSIRYLMLREKLNVHYNQNNNTHSYYNENYHNNKFTSHLISNQEKIELQNLYGPRYMEIYDQCNNLLKDFEIDFNRLKEEQQKRIVPSFNEAESKLINQNIQMISDKMTKKLKKCKYLTKDLKSLYANSISDDNIKINMHQNLLSRLADASRAMQINEELYLKKYQELNGFDESFCNINNINNNTINNFDSIETTQTQHNFFSNSSAKKLDVVKERNKEIDQMVSTLNELKKIFEEASNMVILQGTILDRIDYNTYQARHQIRRGNRELEEAHERLKSGCVRKLNQILIFAIFIMSILIIFKFF
jgi:t-SNARE complex subunit (syntaxin)